VGIDGIAQTQIFKTCYLSLILRNFKLKTRGDNTILGVRPVKPLDKFSKKTYFLLFGRTQHFVNTTTSECQWIEKEAVWCALKGNILYS
jgi:hypothetical protein